MNSAITHLECSVCHQKYDHNVLHSLSTCCKMPLLVRYNLTDVPAKETLIGRPLNMWRYREVLPVLNDINIVSLNEGFTPIHKLENIAEEFECDNLWMKDESVNPTGSFKARGLSMAVSKAKELKVDACIIPTAGNAGGALAAYCAKGQLDCMVVMPAHTPEIFKQECQLYGAEVELVKGLIDQCGARVKEINNTGQYFDVSTLKEPYRIEGKKTMGYEIAEQFNWQLPEVILYPAGGGTGLIGIWKAFKEMVEMGWIEDKLPRMIAVQAFNCQPLVQTWIGNQQDCSGYEGHATLANGLAVPRPIGEKLMLQVLKESKGTTIAIKDKEMLGAQAEIAAREGLWIAPEGAALWSATKKLIESGEISRTEKILLLNTGSGYKYAENLSVSTAENKNLKTAGVVS